MARQLEVHAAHPIADLLHAQLVRLPRSYARRVRLACDVERGQVTIAGDVASFTEKQFVQESLRPAAGEWTMRNELSVC